MNIVDVKCPSCNAPLRVSEDSAYVTCEYCGVTSLVEHPEGTTVLKIAGELKDTIERSQADVQRTVESTAQVTAAELQKMQLINRLTSTRTLLQTLDVEARSLEREKKTGKTKRQLSDLNKQRGELKTQIAQLERQLGETSTNSSSNSNRRRLSCGLLGLLLLSGMLCALFSILSSPTEEGSTANTRTPSVPTAQADPTQAASQERASAVPAETEGPTATVAMTSTSTESENLIKAQATVLRNANLRAGPGSTFDIIGTTTAGETLAVYSRTEDGWLQIDEAGETWIAASLVELDRALETIPVVGTETSSADTRSAIGTPEEISTSIPSASPTLAITLTASLTPLPPSAGLSDWLAHEGTYIGVQDIRWDYSLEGFRAETGKILVSLYVVAVNRSEQQQFYSDSTFSLIDGGGEITSGVIFSEVEPSFSNCSILPGGICEGWWTTMIWDRPEVRSDLSFVWDPPCIFCEDLRVPITQE